MGYKPQPYVYNLTFDQMYAGLEVTMRSMSLGKLSQLITTEFDFRNPANSLEVFDFFAARIVSWNVEHPDIEGKEDDPEALCPKCHNVAGTPVRKEAAALLCLDIKFVMMVINAWMQAVASVSAPKELSISVGERVDELLQTLQTETMPIPNLSQSP